MNETGIAALNEFVKKGLRISTLDAGINAETTGLVSAALADMKMRGIDAYTLCPATATVSGMDPLAVQAVDLYCKANFGAVIDAESNAKFWARYEMLTNSMSFSDDYKLRNEGST